MAGQTILLKGTGGVSIFALQFAKILGARVIITSSSDEKLVRAKAMGADVGLNYRNDPDWQRKVFDETDGQGVDVVSEVIGVGLNESLGYLALNGKIVVSGLLGGSKAGLDILTFMGKKATVLSTKVGSKSSFLAMNKALEVNKLKPVVDKVFPMGAFAEAFAYLEQGRHFGKVVLGF